MTECGFSQEQLAKFGDLLATALAVLQEIGRAGLDPARLYDTKVLAERFGYDDHQRFTQMLAKKGVPIASAGRFVKLVRLQDIYDRCLGGAK